MDINIDTLAIVFEQRGFGKRQIQTAINHIKLWLLDPEFEPFRPLIYELIKEKQYDELFDSFYKILSFGTSGIRGKIGVGYNRINHWTIAATALAHANYLIAIDKNLSKLKGIVIAYDVRKYTDQKLYKNYLSNPLWGVSSRKLAEIAASVYAKKDIKVHFFEDIISTPQLSFTIRELEAIGGINITASHNPPEYNGMKIYNENGAQLLPSHETKLSTHITKTNIYNISWGDFNTRDLLSRVHFIPESVENRYHKAVAQISLSRNRSAKIVFTPLHGTGRTSVFKVLKNMGFNVYLEPEGSFPSGEFESVPNHLPDPANLNVYWHSINQADKKKADIIIATDPDADRAGIMIKNNNKWELLNGNEVNILLTYLVLEKYKKLKSSEIKPVILSTITTTRLIEVITANYKCKAKTDILPGFRYIAQEIEKLDKDKSEKLAIAMDDNYGQLAGCYARDKDGCTASILLSQLTGELKDNKLTLYSALNAAYTKFGFYSSTDHKLKFNFSFESVKIENLMSKLRKKQSALFEHYKVSTFKDYFDLDKPDHSTDLVEFTFEKLGNFEYIRLLIRPSGTEAALKLYIEVGTQKGLSEIEKLRIEANRLHIELKNYFVDYLKKLQA